MAACLDAIRDRALDVMSKGESAINLLTEFATVLEAQMPSGTVIGITVVDAPGRAFKHAAFPSLPAEFAECIAGVRITGTRGSCGMAITTGKIVESNCVATDARFSAEWKALFARHSLEAIISAPALNGEGHSQGSVAAIYRRAFPLTNLQRELLREAAKLCAQIGQYSRTLESQQLLVGELEHRIRNTFATVGAVAILTQRNHPEQIAFRRVLEERLVMMNKAHALATTQQPTELSRLIRDVLAPYSTDFKIEISGPRLQISAEAASAFALVIHELGTNAAKYGALSAPTGKLAVQWDIAAAAEAPDEQCFTLRWVERGGPAVSRPSRKGYGTLVIAGNLRNAFDGAAHTTFESEGFECVISAPCSSRLGRLVKSEAAE